MKNIVFIFMAVFLTIKFLVMTCFQVRGKDAESVKEVFEKLE